MAQKTAKKTAKKKSAPRARSSRPASSQSSAPLPQPVKGKNPLYVLIIMGLVTAIALMINRYNPRQEPGSVPEKKKPLRTEVSVGKNELKEERDEKKNKPVTREKTEKEKEVKARTDEKNRTEDAPETEPVKIYFVRLNEKTEKMYLSPVVRNVPRGGAILENTMKELIKGPTAGEKKKGNLTAVPTGLRINRMRVRNKTAEIDFNGAIEQGASGSILINRIDQIVYTATQFPNVESVIIKINGRQRQTLGTDGLSIGGPLHRRQ